jgi:dTDP-glucose pyrophosphorylase
VRILVPLAGPSDAFQTIPPGPPVCKSLIEIDRKPAIQHVYENLRTIPGAEFTFVVRKDEVHKFHLDAVLRLLDPASTQVVVENPTAGAACTCLLAVEQIDNDRPLVIANGDQILRVDLGDVIDEFRARDLDGGVLVFDAIHPRWSFVRTGPDGLVVEAAEKRPISRHATAGFYYFRRGADFVAAATEMIRKDDHVGGAFYVCPAYNQMILRQKRIGITEVSKDDYFSLATPHGVDLYENFLAAQRGSTRRGDA